MHYSYMVLQKSELILHIMHYAHTFILLISPRCSLELPHPLLHVFLKIQKKLAQTQEGHVKVSNQDLNNHVLLCPRS